MASYYLKLGEPLRLLRVGVLIRENAGVKIRGRMKHLRSVVTSSTCCSDDSIRRKQVNCVPEISGSSYFSRQIKHSHRPDNQTSGYTSWCSLFPFASFTNLYMSARQITFSEIMKLFYRKQDGLSTSSVVQVVTLLKTSWVCNSLVPVWTFHSGRILKYSQNTSTNLAPGVRCCYSTGAVSSELQDKAGKEKMNQMKIHMSDLDIAVNTSTDVVDVLVYKLFSGRYNYSALHRSVILENGLFGNKKTSVGVLSYAFTLLKLRLRVHSQSSGTSVEIGSVNILEDGVIRIRWSLKAVSQTQLVKTLKFSKDADCLDACSYFHVDENGLVKKHIIEKVTTSSKEKAD